MLHGSGLRPDGQMPTLALTAMFRLAATPERLGFARIETVQASLAPSRDVLHEAPTTLPFSPGSAEAERLPVEHSVLSVV